MTTRGLILAAHGSRVEPAVNDHLLDLARRIETLRLFDEVSPAFHHGSPTFANVLDELHSDQILVVPVMTSAGYYCDEVLPRELRKSPRFDAERVHITPPVGVHPRMTELVADRALRIARNLEMSPKRTTLALVGHGTAKNPRSRLATEHLAATIAARGEWMEVLTAFLDESPGVETLLPRARGVSVLVIPFLISAGPHAVSDIPHRLGVSPNGTPPIEWRIDNRRVACDRAIGADEGMVQIILEMATNRLSMVDGRWSIDPGVAARVHP